MTPASQLTSIPFCSIAHPYHYGHRSFAQSSEQVPMLPHRACYPRRVPAETYASRQDRRRISSQVKLGESFSAVYPLRISSKRDVVLNVPANVQIRNTTDPNTNPHAECTNRDLDPSKEEPDRRAPDIQTLSTNSHNQNASHGATVFDTLIGQNLPHIAHEKATPQTSSYITETALPSPELKVCHKKSKSLPFQEPISQPTLLQSPAASRCTKSRSLYLSRIHDRTPEKPVTCKCNPTTFEDILASSPASFVGALTSTPPPPALILQPSPTFTRARKPAAVVEHDPRPAPAQRRPTLTTPILRVFPNTSRQPVSPTHSLSSKGSSGSALAGATVVSPQSYAFSYSSPTTSLPAGVLSPLDSSPETSPRSTSSMGAADIFSMYVHQSSVFEDDDDEKRGLMEYLRFRKDSRGIQTSRVRMEHRIDYRSWRKDWMKLLCCCGDAES